MVGRSVHSPIDWRQLDQPTIETADGWSVGPSPIGWWRPDQPTIGSPVIQVAFPVLLPCLADCNLKITNPYYSGAPGLRAEHPAPPSPGRSRQADPPGGRGAARRRRRVCRTTARGRVRCRRLRGLAASSAVYSSVAGATRGRSSGVVLGDVSYTLTSVRVSPHPGGCPGNGVLHSKGECPRRTRAIRVDRARGRSDG